MTHSPQRTYHSAQHLEKQLRNTREAGDLRFSPPVDDALSLIRKQCSDPKLSLKAASRALNTSAKRLGPLIKRRTGLTFRQYLLRVRMETAIELLTKSDHQIKIIVAMVGYRYQSHFGQDFRKYVGLTPKQFKLSLDSDTMTGTEGAD